MGAPFPFFGYLIVVIAALAFAGNNVFAVLSYEGGTTPLTLITIRMALALIALTILMLVTGRSILLARRERNAALALGVLQAVMSYCLMAAFDHIAVGLAVLIFYLYPVLTALGAWLMRQETLNRGIFIGLIGSFGGLALALGDTGATVSISRHGARRRRRAFHDQRYPAECQNSPDRQLPRGHSPHAYIGRPDICRDQPDCRRIFPSADGPRLDRSDLPFPCSIQLPWRHFLPVSPGLAGSGLRWS